MGARTTRVAPCLRTALAEAERARETLAEELRVIGQLHSITTKVMRHGEWREVLLGILDAALAITHADMGDVQLLDAEANCLRIIVARGFDEAFLDSLRAVYPHTRTSCATAWQQGRRIVIEDMSRSDLFAGTLELELHTRAGSRAVQSTPICSRSGEVLGMFSTHYRVPTTVSARDMELLDMLARHAGDIIGWHLAEQSKVEAQLLAEQRAAEFEALFNSIGEAVFLADEAGAIISFNPAAKRLAGLDDTLTPYAAVRVSSMLGLSEAAGGTYPEETPMSRALRGEAFVNMPYRFVNLQGREIEALTSGGKIETPVGVKAYTLCRDITDLRRLERNKEEFMQVVSHEIRNPLQVLQGLVQLIDLKLDDQSRRSLGKHLHSLHSQVNYLAALADDILTAYRLGTGKMAIEVRETHLLDTLAEVVSPHLHEGTHKLTTEYSVPPALRVRADPQRLIQIVSNLLSNARKYTPEGKGIWVKASVEDWVAVVRIEDEGIGIPADQREKVFEGFVRAHNVTEWRSGGIGLGLYISRNLARRMGGDIYAEQRLGGGTAMVLKLPVAAS